jgi:hypothetical protein
MAEDAIESIAHVCFRSATPLSSAHILVTGRKTGGFASPSLDGFAFSLSKHRAQARCDSTLTVNIVVKRNRNR